MAGKVFRIVLALAVHVVHGFGEDADTVLTGSRAVRVGVFNTDLSDVRVIGGDIAFGDCDASTADSHLDSVIGNAEADRESEGGAKPVGRNAGVGIDENRNDGARRDGAV